MKTDWRGTSSFANPFAETVESSQDAIDHALRGYRYEDLTSDLWKWGDVDENSEKLRRSADFFATPGLLLERQRRAVALDYPVAIALRIRKAG